MILILFTLNCISASGKAVVHPIVVMSKNSPDQEAQGYVAYFKNQESSKCSFMFRLINILCNQTGQAPWLTGSLHIFFLDVTR